MSEPAAPFVTVSLPMDQAVALADHPAKLSPDDPGLLWATKVKAACVTLHEAITATRNAERVAGTTVGELVRSLHMAGPHRKVVIDGRPAAILAMPYVGPVVLGGGRSDEPVEATVTLSIVEAVALVAAVQGDHFEPADIDSAIAKVEAVKGDVLP